MSAETISQLSEDELRYEIINDQLARSEQMAVAGEIPTPKVLANQLEALFSANHDQTEIPDVYDAYIDSDKKDAFVTRIESFNKAQKTADNPATNSYEDLSKEEQLEYRAAVQAEKAAGGSAHSASRAYFRSRNQKIADNLESVKQKAQLAVALENASNYAAEQESGSYTQHLLDKLRSTPVTWGHDERIPGTAAAAAAEPIDLSNTGSTIRKARHLKSVDNTDAAEPVKSGDTTVDPKFSPEPPNYPKKGP